MMDDRTILLREDKYAKRDVKIMKWATTVDLLAIANVDGEVVIHRLSFQRVWALAPPKEGVGVVEITWNPQSSHLAIAYDNNFIYIVNVEGKIAVEKIETPSKVSCMRWMEESKQEEDASHKYISFVQEMDEILPKLTPELPQDIGLPTVDERSVMVNKDRLNFLIVGLESGKLQLYTFGIYLCGTLDFGNNKIVHADFTPNLKTLIAAIAERNEADNKFHLKCAVVDTTKFAESSTQLFHLTKYRSLMASHMKYLEETVNSLIEAKETIYLEEMALKIAKFSKNKSGDETCAEWLRLFMFGVLRPEFEIFLVTEMSANKLKKISVSISLCHDAMKKLIHKRLRLILDTIISRLSIIMSVGGNAAWCSSYPRVKESVCTDAMELAQACYLKSLDILTILEDSAIKYKAFFKWLTAITTAINDENSMKSISDALNKEERNLVFNYLNNVHKLKDSTNEREDAMSYYFKDADLPRNMERKGHADEFWKTFLKECPCAADVPLILPARFESLSFVGVINELKLHVREKLFENYSAFLANVDETRVYFLSETHDLKISALNANNDEMLFTYWTPKGVGVTSVNSSTRVMKKGVAAFRFMKLVDFDIYSFSILSALLEDKNNKENRFVCVSLDKLRESFVDGDSTVCSPFYVGERAPYPHPSKIENMSAVRIATSGNRKVCAILADNMRRIQIFETEGDTEDDDVDSNSSLNDSMIAQVGIDKGDSFLTFCFDQRTAAKDNMDDLSSDDNGAAVAFTNENDTP